MSDYEPGTVAIATVDYYAGGGRREPTEMHVSRYNGGWANLCDPDEFWIDSNGFVTDVRPLVVLDLSGWLPEYVAALPEWLRSKCHDAPSESAVRHLADQIEAQMKHPKPAEPTGFGAVVEDAEGADWHRTREGRWIAADGLRTRACGWGHIEAVKVLSEGDMTR